MRPALLLSVAGILATPVSSGAQALPARFELDGGVRWTGPISVGRVDANETGADGRQYRLFTTTSDVGAAVGAEGRIGVRLTRSLRAEASASYTPAHLTTRIASDVEAASATIAAERVRQFAFEGGVALTLPRWRLTARGLPFLAAGAGVLRRVHEGATLADNGRLYFIGGGVAYPFRQMQAGGRKAAGVRIDARASIVSGRLSFDGSAHVTPAVTGSLFVRF